MPVTAGLHTTYAHHQKSWGIDEIRDLDFFPQTKAQTEIDAVCDHDKSVLPYVEGLVWEVLRWGAITPLGLPHCFTENVGLKIKENMLAFANIG